MFFWGVRPKNANIPPDYKILNRGKQTKPITLKTNGVEVTDAKEVANQFNKYFATVGPDLARAVGQCNHNFEEFMGNRIIENFTIGPITETELTNTIKQLNNLNLKLVLIELCQTYKI